MDNIVIIGSGGFAKEVGFLIECINKKEKKWNLLGYIDNHSNVLKSKYKVYNDDSWLLNSNNKINAVIAIGNPLAIKELHKKFSINSNILYPNLIHPDFSGDLDRITFGMGNIICSSNTFTTDIKIGNFNIFNINCCIGHDSLIGNYNVINPSSTISGNTIIEDQVFFGTSSSILQNLSVCSNAIIGAGALVTKKIKEPGTYIGMPAKKRQK